MPETTALIEPSAPQEIARPPEFPDPRPNTAVAIVAGLVAGLLSTTLGVGGGIIIVPALSMFGRVPIKRAAGISLTFIFCTTVVSLTAMYMTPQRDEIHLDVALILAAASVPGSLIGRWLNQRVPVRAFTYAFCLLLGVAAARLLFPKVGFAMHLPLDFGIEHPVSVLYLLGVGLMAGIAASMLGPGGGVVVVPALAIGFDLFGQRFKTATATSLAMIVPVSLFSSMLHWRAKNVNVRLVAIMAPFGISGAIGGIFLRDVVDGDILRKVFAGLMIAALVGMIAQARKK